MSTFTDSVVTPQSLCNFGIARADITPPVGIYHRMWGAATHDRATGVHRPLTATAMAFRAGDSAPGDAGEQILVAVDLCLLWAREMNALLDTVGELTGMPRERIAVTFSHTHAAGLMGLERKHLPGGELIPPFLDRVAHEIARIIQQARRGLQPAVIAYGYGRCRLAGHRDFWDAQSGQFVCGYNPQGPADDTVLVARVTTPDNHPLATVVNYACHPTTLAWDNTLISPDFPGALREVVEQATGVPCVFLQGASGDLGPREGFVGDVAVADRNGRQLGYAALAALEELPPPLTRFTYRGPVISGATIGTWAHESIASKSSTGHAQLSLWSVQRFSVELPYRSDLPGRDETLRDKEIWQKREADTRAAGDAQEVRDCRAMVERLTRRLTRLENLPPGSTFPFPIILWRMGDALWLAVENELYNWFQRTLRDRFPVNPIIIATLTNGSRASYLPTAETYGKGIYQESVAVLAPGSLERLCDAVTLKIHQFLK